MRRSKRFEVLEKRPVNQDGLIGEWPEEGLIAMGSPWDPSSSVKVENGRIVELDGKARADFDMIDRFIADYAININETEHAMSLDALTIARMLVDIHVDRAEIIKITTAITPAKAVEVMAHMNVVEMMMAMQKMRARRTPSNQCHVTNLKDNPVQIAADAAEAGIRGFSEQETTVGIARYAPFNALGLLIGSQSGRPGVLTQCSVEEATELELGMRGFTSYAETVSVYGTEAVFTDGDDTPWSKGFLASAYASRGLKMRYTSGTGSEALMGYAESKSMLYLESRCIFITKGAGVQGLQNGAVSCIGMTGAVPSGIRAVLAENLIASMLDLEVASANDQTFSHSDIRRTARTLMQMLPGTDFIFSGYSAVPNYDNMFAGSNFDAEDFDDYNILQRDLMVDGGLRPVSEAETIAIRNKAARAVQAVFRELGLPPVTDEEVTAATYAHGSKDMPSRNVVEDLSAVEDMMQRNITGLDIVKALSINGFDDVANNILAMLRQRVTGDYLQTSAILDRQFEVVSAVNDVNDYQGPGTGYRLSPERWEEIKNIATVIQPDSIE
ncbi:MULTISPECIES: propanediol/glycerol family dehydratase large subunit [Enterobacteriaceae]|uniref:Propanediol dehydratase n=1 Tax=Kluyvera genomosp. 2 TaxID=2774054 RepID=A0A2T2XZB5_9ENTR|nr:MULTISPECIES: propanediol/glycerol family dehydratase large subunit [Enterobacteriaceae]HAT3919341.1 propanediol/glycerol family dehydratase large subunit [Kluyvera ascorbata]PSR45601.1 propanediol dehydratase [Kluyvera genomosp. 2]BBQ84508.1 propanediol dehydratase large subunit [Klebsiella sp. WP3-W18-ESBL-02]BBR21560.1 propanediol dehydratase large subunit [Klebsiella sp. WP3-S18-ESBL-05]BBS92417.1 propanediol dehydratase large subunit [Klebsiella sp. WP7-S18-CRE-02]